jgi:hypothetical protein
MGRRLVREKGGRTMQLAEVEAKVLEDDLSKRDFTVDPEHLQITEEGRLVIEEGARYPC